MLAGDLRLTCSKIQFSADKAIGLAVLKWILNTWAINYKATKTITKSTDKTLSQVLRSERVATHLLKIPFSRDVAIVLASFKWIISGSHLTRSSRDSLVQRLEKNHTHSVQGSCPVQSSANKWRAVFKADTHPSVLCEILSLTRKSFLPELFLLITAALPGVRDNCSHYNIYTCVLLQNENCKRRQRREMVM